MQRRPRDPQRVLPRAAFLNGKVNRVAPRVIKHGASNQCWISGTIRLKTGKIEIVEAFAPRRRTGFAGVFQSQRVGVGTLLAVRY